MPQHLAAPLTYRSYIDTVYNTCGTAVGPRAKCSKEIYSPHNDSHTPARDILSFSLS